MGEFTIEDFSKPITSVNGDQTAVFWDVVEFPFPDSDSPDMIYRKIESAVREKGCRGQVSIWVYVDDKNGSWGGEFLHRKTWESRIFFLPGGDKLSRHNRMFHDLLLWMIDSPVLGGVESTVFVFSDKVKEEFFDTLESLTNVRCDNVYLTPSKQPVIKAEHAEWPRWLFDSLYAFIVYILSKKHLTGSKKLLTGSKMKIVLD
ncbi:uncharacterized protein LOC112086745 [Eutrema salsugineum]|uniref:uncharacterized protein LOC112086745 n=1 Tax=Eutrema salsugineum TaxID=72664 RepID=UPI000CED007E|nr:uncharacterized protein LOC112086745 [Eutrema salsugineum]